MLTNKPFINLNHEQEIPKQKISCPEADHSLIKGIGRIKRCEANGERSKGCKPRTQEIIQVTSCLSKKAGEEERKSGKSAIEEEIQIIKSRGEKKSEKSPTTKSCKNSQKGTSELIQERTHFQLIFSSIH